MSIYSTYGVKRVVNAAFHLTRLGGSTLSPRVLKAMEEANESYVCMWGLIKKMREGDPEGWVRYQRSSNDFIINTLNLRSGDEDIIVERFKEIFG
ncbi:MAG: hypothetical protein NWE89_11425 [Candidatus Bathyarchaeota archaeon]|nr:hypothetical protein [Candidatus Bathyarchaeota archaeon]